MDKVAGGGATRLRRVWETLCVDLVPGKRHEPGLGAVGEPRAGTIIGLDNGPCRQPLAHTISGR